MSSEFASALMGAIVGGFFTLVGSFGATMLAESRNQAKADRAALVQVRELLRELHTSLVVERDARTQTNQTTQTEQIEMTARMEGVLKIRQISALATTLHKNLELGVRLQRLYTADVEDVERLMDDVRIATNPKLAKMHNTSRALP